MKRKLRLLFIIVLTISVSGLGFGQDMRVILEAAGLKQASAPRLISGHILFSYQFAAERRDGQVHSVAAAFEYENFSRIHEFSVNESDVFVLLLPHAGEVDRYRYRLVIDGVWGPDPNAPDQVVDRWGVRLSEYTPPATGRPSVSFPAVSEDGRVEFQLQLESGKLVSLVGSFNGWDPFMTPMIETEPGVYRRVLRLTKGEHLYYYMVDGRRFSDPGNGEMRWNTDGMIVSAVRLP